MKGGAATWFVRATVASGIIFVLVASASIPRRGDSRELLIWPFAILISAMLGGVFLLDRKFQLVFAASSLAAAAVIIPLEWYLAHRNDSLRRADARQRLLPVIRNGAVEVFPFQSPWELNFGQKWYTTNGAPLLPLGSIAGRVTRLCWANGDELLFRSDEHGFRNPEGVHALNPADIVIIGDSFAQGYCVRESESIAGRIRGVFPRTANLAVTAAGPLWELAVFREYGAPLRPRMLLWIYYEGNDLSALTEERLGFASKYLNPAFSQNLRSRQREIDGAFIRRVDSLGRALGRPNANRLERIVVLREIRSILKLNLRQEPASADLRDPRDNLPTLFRVLRSATSIAESWGGASLFVYLPTPGTHRAEQTSRLSDSVWTTMRPAVLATAAASGMNVLDMTGSFRANAQVQQDLGDGEGHYSARGYRLVSDSLIGRILSSGVAPPRKQVGSPSAR